MSAREPSEPEFERRYPVRPIVGVGAVILVTAADGGRITGLGAVPHPWGVVLIKRWFEPLAGEWSLPGGAVEVGETLEAAVAREMAEETGLRVEVGPVIEVFDRIVLDGGGRAQYHYVLIDYLCRPSGGHLAHGSDVSDVTIADPAALGRFALTAKAEAVIRQALALATVGPAPA